MLGRVEVDCKLGPRTVLTTDEEACYIVEMVDMGFGLSRDDIKVAAYRIVEKCERSHPFHNEMAGRAWLDGFTKRHPNLTLRTP